MAYFVMQGVWDFNSESDIDYVRVMKTQLSMGTLQICSNRFDGSSQLVY